MKAATFVEEGKRGCHQAPKAFRGLQRPNVCLHLPSFVSQLHRPLTPAAGPYMSTDWMGSNISPILGGVHPNEITFLKRFKEKHDLGYDFAVSDGQELQHVYAATSLPTAVLIDRKGLIRYIESGTNPSRIEELRGMVLKLLNEK